LPDILPLAVLTIPASPPPPRLPIPFIRLRPFFDYLMIILLPCFMPLISFDAHAGFILRTLCYLRLCLIYLLRDYCFDFPFCRLPMPPVAHSSVHYIEPCRHQDLFTICATAYAAI